jgi:alpha-L-fucosidase
MKNYLTDDGYQFYDTFKSPEFVVDQLVDIVSKNGNLLLNIGPRSDGTIPEPVQQVLLDVGAWLTINGEAIYGTRPWRVYGEGPTKAAAGSFHDTDVQKYTAADFRFTTKGDALYAIGFAWPAGGEAVIQSLAPAAGSELVRAVSLVGSEAKLRFEQRADGLHVQLPAQAPAKYAYVLRLTFERAPH